jgi:Rieske Fe-S protein
MNQEEDCPPPSTCGCSDGTTRREFLHSTPCALITALTASGLPLNARTTFDFGSPVEAQGTEHAYALPANDEVTIDRDNDVILVRQASRIYAFSLSCPHENTALRWRQDDLRFQCPRHESKYQPDGTFLTGRATRNMDRFAVRLDGQKVVVDLNKLYRSDQQKSEWDSAVIKL